MKINICFYTNKKYSYIESTLIENLTTKGFDKILSSENREGYLQIIQKLTRTKLIVKDNKVLIIW